MSSKIRGNLVTAVAWNSSNTSERLVVISSDFYVITQEHLHVYMMYIL